MWRSWWAMGLSVLLVPTAWGASRFGTEPLTSAELARLPLPVFKAYVRERIAQQQLRGERAGVDTEAPVLTRLSVAPQVTAGGAVVVDLHASDKGSGINQFWAWGETPRQVLNMSYQFMAPQWALGGSLSTEVSPYMPPGPVTLNGAVVLDWAGNFTLYEGEALAALGRLQTTVINPLGGDSTPPELVGGVIETPRISQSRNSPGTDVSRFARATLTVRDSGDPQVSGPTSSSLWFCTLDSSSCFWMSSEWPGPGQTPVPLRFAAQLRRPDIFPGLHYIRELVLTDRAGNHRSYISLRFPEGNSDMSVLFPQGDSILVKR